MAEPAHRRILVNRVLFTAALANVGISLTVYLFGAVGPFLRADLGFSERDLGAAVSAFFVASAGFSALAGRVSDRLGHWTALSFSSALGVACGLAMASFASNWLHVLVVLSVAGVANAVVQPATNLALTRELPALVQGRAFGIKQSAGPTAVLLAGLMVPGIALTVGWRWAFVLAAGISAVTLLLASTATPTAVAAELESHRGAGLRHRLLVGLAAAVLLAVAAASGLTVFFVESAIAQGHSAGVAGFWLAVGGALAIVGRVLFGRWTDTRGMRRLPLVVRLLVVGALGFILLGHAEMTVVLALGTVLAFGAGWGWLGLYQHGVVRLSPEAPATATGAIMVGVFVGGVIGPFAFGWIVENYSYSIAWWVAGLSYLASAGFTSAVVGRIRRQWPR